MLPRVASGCLRYRRDLLSPLFLQLARAAPTAAWQAYFAQVFALLRPLLRHTDDGIREHAALAIRDLAAWQVALLEGVLETLVPDLLGASTDTSREVCALADEALDAVGEWRNVDVVEDRWHSARHRPEPTRPGFHTTPCQSSFPLPSPTVIVSPSFSNTHRFPFLLQQFGSLLSAALMLPYHTTPAALSSPTTFSAARACPLLQQSGPPLPSSAVRNADAARCIDILLHHLPSSPSVPAPLSQLQATIKCIGRVCAAMSQASALRATPRLVGPLCAAMGHASADVRKAVVFALVDLWSVVGDALSVHLRPHLTDSQMRLVAIYVSRLRERAAAGSEGELVS